MKPIRISLLLALVVSVVAVPSDAYAQAALPILSRPNLSLADALTVAAENNVTLRQTRAEAEDAEATVQGAQAQTRPSLSATTYAATGDSANILTTSPGVGPQNIFAVAPRPFANQNLMLMVPLLTGGRLGNNVTAAHRQSEAMALSVLGSRLVVAEVVTENYANAALQQSLVSVAQARLTAETEQVRVTQEKVNTGRSAPVDLLREQAELADATQALLAAQNSAALTLVSLKIALGISQTSPITLADTLDTLAGANSKLPASLSEALAQASRHRPEPAAALRQVEAAQAALKAAQGEYAPQVYGVAMADAATGQGAGRTGYTVGLTASLPLYDGGQRRAGVDSAKAKLNRAYADVQGMRQQVDQEAATAWLNVQTAAAQVQSAFAGVTASQQGYDLATLRYNAGKSVTAERLDALTALVRAQGALAQAKASLVIGRARLQAALGSPLSPIPQ